MILDNGEADNFQDAGGETVVKEEVASYEDRNKADLAMMEAPDEEDINNNPYIMSRDVALG